MAPPPRLHPTPPRLGGAIRPPPPPGGREIKTPPLSPPNHSPITPQLRFCGHQAAVNIIKTAYSPRHHPFAAVPPADNADLLRSNANSLFGQYFRLNDIPQAPTLRTGFQ